MKNRTKVIGYMQCCAHVPPLFILPITKRLLAALRHNGSQICDGGGFRSRNFHFNTNINMEHKTTSNHETPPIANVLLGDVNSLPREVNFKGSRVFLRCYDYFDEDANDICYCVEYKNDNGHPKIWSYSLLKHDAVNKMAIKLRELGFNIA